MASLDTSGDFKLLARSVGIWIAIFLVLFALAAGFRWWSDRMNAPEPAQPQETP